MEAWESGHQAVNTYPNKFTEFVATNPVTSLLVPGAKDFLAKGGSPTAMDVGLLGIDLVTPMIPVGALAGKMVTKRPKPKTKRKTKRKTKLTPWKQYGSEIEKEITDHGLVKYFYKGRPFKERQILKKTGAPTNFPKDVFFRIEGHSGDFPGEVGREIRDLWFMDAKDYPYGGVGGRGEWRDWKKRR